MDGVVRTPSAFSMTFALLPSITATQELVVPRSIPIAFAMIRLLVWVRDVRELLRPIKPPRRSPRKCNGNCASLSNLTVLCRVRDAQSASGETASASRNRLGGSQAAFLACPSEASLTSIFFGSGFAGFGIAIFRTPLDIVAWTLYGSSAG